MIDAPHTRPAAAPRRRGRPAPGDPTVANDDALLRGVFAAFADHGFEGAAIREIARDMGVSNNLLHARFGSKEEMWRRAVDHCFADAVTALWPTFLRPGLDPLDRLSALIQRFADFSAVHPDLIAMVNLEGRRRSWRTDHLHDHYVAPFRARLDALLHDVAATRSARRISTDAFMALLVSGIGQFFAARALRELVDRSAGPTDAAHLEDFVQLLRPALLQPLAAPGHDRITGAAG